MLSVNLYDEAAGVARQHYGLPACTTAGVTASGPAGRFGYSGAG